MAAKNDKWMMFRNYMHNELGITKEDIKEWIQDAIHQEIENVVHQAYGKCDIQQEIRNTIYSSSCWHEDSFKDEVMKRAGECIADRLELTFKK